MKNKMMMLFEQSCFPQTKALPTFRPGDSVRVDYKVPEGDSKTKFRIQTFEGIVTRRRRGTTNATFTVRKIAANSVGVERVFPSNSPFIDKIEIVSQGVVRRSRLYYLRDLRGKAARIRSRLVARKTEKTK